MRATAAIWRSRPPRALIWSGMLSKRIRRYTYEVTNYPTGESGVQANLMLYRTTVVGGEVLSPRMDGFVHGLIDLSSDTQSTS